MISGLLNSNTKLKIIQKLCKNVFLQERLVLQIFSSNCEHTTEVFDKYAKVLLQQKFNFFDSNQQNYYQNMMYKQF